MTHNSQKDMLFYFLQTRDYNQDSGKLSFEMGYDLGDYSPKDKEWYKIARDCAQLLRSRLAGVFNDNGDVNKEIWNDDFGLFHKDE